MVKFGDDIAVDKNSVHLSCNVTDDLPGNIWRKEIQKSKHILECKEWGGVGGRAQWAYLSRFYKMIQNDSGVHLEVFSPDEWDGAKR